VALNLPEVSSGPARPKEAIDDWIHNCETANRRVDVAEFIAWARACEADPQSALARFLKTI
jgi:hypothetical protein